MRRLAPGGAQKEAPGRKPGARYRSECLDWLLIFGRRQLERVLRTDVDHYNRQRPHRALDLNAPEPGRASSCNFRRAD